MASGDMISKFGENAFTTVMLEDHIQAKYIKKNTILNGMADG
jgi:hypothetical protein